MKELTVEASVDNLGEVLDFINNDLERNNCPPDLQNQINIAVEEIFVNIANYAYKPANGNVTICISTEEKTVIRFEDTGKPYNPLEHPPPDLNKPPMERAIGGLGVYMVRQLMDEVAYTYSDNKNILIIEKQLQ